MTLLPTATDIAVTTALAKQAERNEPFIRMYRKSVQDRRGLLTDLRAFKLDLSEVVIGADLDFQVERLGELIERYSNE